MSKQQKTKQGMASIYVVVFVTMLIGVITLSFLRIMLSETGRTEKSTLSDSALNSAMAGVEDAKSVLMAYHNCPDVGGGAACDRARDAIQNAKNSTDECDFGSDVKGESTVGIDDGTGSISDQAYTCVNISITGNYKGALTPDRPVLVVPMRIADSSKIGDIDGVQLSWKSHNNGGMAQVGTIDANYTNGVNNIQNNGVLGQSGVIYDGGSDERIAQNGLKVSLIQSGSAYDINTFYSSTGNTTDRGTLMLLPAVNGKTEVAADEFVKSADKTYNSPIGVNCSADTQGECGVKLKFPNPSTGARIEDNFFLVISSVYSEPLVDDITVTMFDKSGNNVDFFDVQPVVDSTGRAGDIVRRVEVRLNPDYAALVPLAELTVDGDLNKDFFVTKNCIKGTGTCN